MYERWKNHKFAQRAIIFELCAAGNGFGANVIDMLRSRRKEEVEKVPDRMKKQVMRRVPLMDQFTSKAPLNWRRSKDRHDEKENIEPGGGDV